MTIQTVNPQPFTQKARQIKTQASTILTRRGLLPRFERWRLTQDPATGMVVLFGVLNNRYIATHTSIPISDYFDPRLLHDLANELQVQVVSCNSNGLRYAFILNRGQLGKLPVHIDFPFIDNGKPFVRVVYGDNPRAIPAASEDIARIDDHSLVRQGVGAFLKVFNDIQLRDDAASQIPAQNLPDIVVIDETEFKNWVVAHEVNDQKVRPELLSTK